MDPLKKVQRNLYFRESFLVCFVFKLVIITYSILYGFEREIGKVGF